MRTRGGSGRRARSIHGQVSRRSGPSHGRWGPATALAVAGTLGRGDDLFLTVVFSFDEIDEGSMTSRPATGAAMHRPRERSEAVSTICSADWPNRMQSASMPGSACAAPGCKAQRALACFCLRVHCADEVPVKSRSNLRGRSFYCMEARIFISAWFLSVEFDCVHENIYIFSLDSCLSKKLVFAIGEGLHQAGSDRSGSTEGSARREPAR